MKKTILMMMTLACLIFGVTSCGSDDDSTGSGSTFTLKGSDS